ncbi:MAG TPA: histidine kinase dimerization/phospho-acceptor domain-containing protein [Terracidiphilus sp.]|nr:histidine kinase dimerization/phospho-acceptor domain-containing protein [Terracidiphilus sp.]
MHDLYHAPALVLTALALPTFGYLYLRFRDARTLFWLLGFFFDLMGMALVDTAKWMNIPAHELRWLTAVAQACIQIAPIMFLGSLSPLRFSVGRFQILYGIPYAVLFVTYAVLLYGTFGGVAPGPPRFLVFPVLAVAALVVAILWNAEKNHVPVWLGLLICAGVGSEALWSLYTRGPAWSLVFGDCANLFMCALLVIFVFKRFTPGVFLSALGFGAWSLACLEVLPLFSSQHPLLNLALLRVVVMARVVAAIGMIVLVLEDELNYNKVAREREHRARRELEAYTRLMLARRRIEDFDRQGPDICELVVKHSCFTQAAFLLHSGGSYRLVGSAGLGDATVKALSEVATRIPTTGFLAPGTVPPAVEESQTVMLDLGPWLNPGDDLKRLHFTEVLAVPMTTRGTIEGALLLSGMQTEPERAGERPRELRHEDLLPIELLVARLQATRSQTIMFEKLIDSEKFAHLGQLAANVTQQLNNPLTVILGYASLLDETANLSKEDRKAVDSILAEARHMRATLESLSRVSRTQSDQQAAVSVTELLSDMGELHRSEFLRRSIEFRLNIAPSLPRVLCSPQQLRQAVRHCLQFAMDAVEKPAPVTGEPKTIRLEAASEGNVVQILIGHTGLGFTNPERAFDPFAPARPGNETAGLGLSLCATILRDNNGRALALNLEPQGAAIILELRAA